MNVLTTQTQFVAPDSNVFNLSVSSFSSGRPNNGIGNIPNDSKNEILKYWLELEEFPCILSSEHRENVHFSSEYLMVRLSSHSSPLDVIRFQVIQSINESDTGI
jgi:hypothetical protein